MENTYPVCLADSQNMHKLENLQPTRKLHGLSMWIPILKQQTDLSVNIMNGIATRDHQFNNLQRMLDMELEYQTKWFNMCTCMSYHIECDRYLSWTGAPVILCHTECKQHDQWNKKRANPVKQQGNERNLNTPVSSKSTPHQHPCLTAKLKKRHFTNGAINFWKQTSLKIPNNRKMENTHPVCLAEFQNVYKGKSLKQIRKEDGPWMRLHTAKFQIHFLIQWMTLLYIHIRSPFLIYTMYVIQSNNIKQTGQHAWVIKLKMTLEHQWNIYCKHCLPKRFPEWRQE